MKMKNQCRTEKDVTTARSRVLLEKLIVVHLVKKFPA
jgi:hypothetical protein